MPHSALGTRALARLARFESRRISGVPWFDPLPAPVHPVEAQTIAGSSGLFEEAQLGRILACGFRSSIDAEIGKLEQATFASIPLTEYFLENAIIAGGQILTPNARHFLGALPPLRSLRTRPRHFDTATLLNSEQGLKYFGHWLRDDCALYEELRQAPNLISMRRPDWPDRHVYEAAFDQQWNEVEFAHVARLTLCRELGFGSDKARRLRLLRQKLRRTHSGANAGRIVYLGRGAGGAARDMSNRKEMEAAFEAAGIRIVRPETGAADLVDALLDAEMIITVEGSQAAHGVYTLADGGAMLILQPPERFYNPHYEWTQLLEMRYGITIGEKDEISYRIYPDEVFAMIDRLLNPPHSARA